VRKVTWSGPPGAGAGERRAVGSDVLRGLSLSLACVFMTCCAASEVATGPVAAVEHRKPAIPQYLGSRRALAPPPAGVLRLQRTLDLPRGVNRSDEGRLYSEVDGMEMVLVPEVIYRAGTDEEPITDSMVAVPPHDVVVGPLLMDRHEVTNAQFARFCGATGYLTEAERGVGTGYGGGPDLNWRKPRGRGSSVDARGDWPVLWVSWNDAVAYCRWAGRRLPTEAEFEYALRGGLQVTTFPWGNDAVPSKYCGNFSDETTRWHRGNRESEFTGVAGYDDGYPEDSPVALFEQNALGLFDISGNLWEWVGYAYDAEGYAGAHRGNPAGPPEDGWKVQRGGSWASSHKALKCTVRTAYRATFSVGDLGFRGVMDIGPRQPE